MALGVARLAGIVVGSFVVVGLVGCSLPDRETAQASGSPAASGPLDASWIEPTPSAEEAALATWIRQPSAAALVNAASLRTLAAAYPLPSSAAGSLLASAAGDAAEQSAALGAKDYSRANALGNRLATTFTRLPDAVSADSAAISFGAVSSTHQVRVIQWIDGDTVQTSAGRVRLIGLDTQEMTDRCSRAQVAKARAESLAPAGSFVTQVYPASVQDTDRYGRLLRYVVAGRTDVGFAQIRSHLAIARYDSADGYDQHPRQPDYRAADQGDPGDQELCYEPLSSGGTAATSPSGAAMVAVIGNGDDHDALRAAALSAAGYYAGVTVARQKADVVAAARATATRAAAMRAAEKAAAAKKAAVAKKAAQKSPPKKKSTKKKSSSSGSNPSGYTGPRCYAPGGQTWRPC